VILASILTKFRRTEQYQVQRVHVVPNPTRGSRNEFAFRASTKWQFALCRKRKCLFKTVIFIHGWPDSWRTWQTTIPYLASYESSASPLHIIAVDVMGFGLSKVDTEKDTLVQDFLELLDKLNLQKVALVGHSMGSMIARKVAIQAPGKVEKLVLMGSTPSGQAAGKFVEQQYHILSMKQVDAQFARDFQTIADPSKVPEWFVETVIEETIRNNLETAWKKGLRFIIDDAPDYASFSKITAKTLLIRGEHDDIFDDAAQQELLALIRGSTLVTVPGTGHNLQWDKPRKIAELLNDFLLS